MEISFETRSKIKEIIEDVTNTNIEEFNDDDICPEQIEQWDSLAHLNAVISIEEAFKIEILPEEILIMMKGYNSIIEILNKYGIN
jgi:hypothetical protein